MWFKKKKDKYAQYTNTREYYMYCTGVKKISIFFGLIQDKDNSYTHFYRKIQILYDVFVFSLKHIVFTFNLQGFFYL